MIRITSAIMLFACVFASQPQRVVHCPTAGLAEHGTMITQMTIFEGGGARAKISLGLWDVLQVGISYGALGLVGSGTVDPAFGLELRIRSLVESEKLPAILIGLDMEGFGPYNDNAKRYEHKSRGAYLVASKNWLWFHGNLGLHGGVNYSLEEKAARGFSVFIGLDKDFKEIVSMRLEYDLAPSDLKDPYGGYGYFSSAVAFSFGESAWISINLFDILCNAPLRARPSRELMFGFNAGLFK